MLDSKGIPDQSRIETDICIIGAGAAGISLALGLAASRHRVCILESGGLEFERQTQDLYRGVNAGLEYEPLDLCRVRNFGGSTGPMGWGGWCKPLSRIDFAQRPWVTLSGWPIDIDALQPYYARARAILGFPEDPAPSSRLLPTDGLLPLSTTRLENELCPLSPAPNLGGTCFARLRASENIQVLLHANATEIVTDGAQARAVGVNVATLTGRRFFVAARYVVLAAGGLENARLLLVSNRVQSSGLGNRSDFVGRCFMEHPRFSWGNLDGRDLTGKLWRYDPGAVVRQRRALSRDLSIMPILGAGLALTAGVQSDAGLLNARSWIVPVAGDGESEGGQELKELVFWLKKKRLPSDLPKRLPRIARDVSGATAAAAAHVLQRLRPTGRYQFITVMEQEPNLSSRVTLDSTCDALGLNRIKLDWQLGYLEEHTLRWNQALIIEELSAIGVKCSVDPSEQGQPGQQLKPKWVWHHIGTTRMSADEKTGVVDADCRVYGVKNLYVAGSSVFPTGGNDMPTLTVAALAYRLAEHLRAQIGREDRSIEMATVSCPTFDVVDSGASRIMA